MKKLLTVFLILGSFARAEVRAQTIPPKILTQPQDQKVAAGQDVTFSAQAEGSDPLSFQWQFNGAEVPGATQSSYTRLGVQDWDAGKYSVRVANHLGQILSTNAILTIFSPPTIFAQPQSLIVTQENTATFGITAIGVPPPSYQWRFNETNMADGPGITGTTESSLTLIGTRLPQAGGYSVVLSNLHGAATSAIATLTVVPRGVPIPISAGDYTQNFDSLAGPGVDSGAWENGLTLPGWYAERGVPQPFTNYFTSWGNTNPGSLFFQGWLYSFGAPGSTERALGSVGSNTASNIVYGVRFANDTALVVSNFALSYTGEQWRNGGNTNTQFLAFSYAAGAPPLTELDADNTQPFWIPVPPLDFATPVTGTTAEPLDGNWISNRHAFAYRVVSGLAVAPGQELLLRWWDRNDLGNDHAVAIDDVSVRFNVAAPSILAQPQDQTAPVGGQAGFVVGASGTPPLEYQWFHKQLPVADATDATLTFASVQPEDAGSYYVVVSNPFGSIASSGASLDVQVETSPEITLQPKSQDLRVGNPATLAAAASGTAPLSFQWYFNGQLLAAATSSSLSFPAVGVVNDGAYKVVVSNESGSVTSAPANLTIYTAPAILQGPASLQVNLGASAKFSVIATSSRPLSYQWFFDGSPIQGATGTSYSLNNVPFGAGGNYSVTVSNFGGSALSPAAALIVLPFASPAPALSSYSLTLRSGLNLVANQLNRGGNTLNEIMPAVPDGSVAAKYDNAAGTWLISTYVAALGAWNPAGFTLSPGEGAFLDIPADFTLTFTGTPNVPVLPVPIPEGATYLVSRQTNAVGTYENILGAAPGPGAVVYKWDNSNATYSVYSNSESGWTGGIAPTAAIGESLWIAPAGGTPPPIPVPPSISVQPMSVITTQGGLAAFSVTATGSEPLKYQWRLNGNIIPGATSSVLTISEVQPGNAGIYSATVNNLVGSVNSDSAQLSISSLPILPFADNFSGAGAIGLEGATSGLGTGLSLGATMEPGEPTPNFIAAGASLWLRWEPQASGRATVTTAGSSFDTVLGVYTGSGVTSLAQVAADDDGAPSLCSATTFNVAAGTVYYIQVSGFHGVAGDIVLSWQLEIPPALPPVILTQPHGQTVPDGAPTALSVVVQPESPVTYQWYLEGQALAGATIAELTIPAMALANVGNYFVAVTNPETFAGVISLPARLQLIVAGAGQQGNPANVSAQDKFLTATDLTPPDPNIPRDPPPASGYTGTQTFSTSGATSDPSEPNHCGYPACGSYWFSYAAPASGMLTIDTKGTSFNAVLAVYTGPGTSFSSLVPVACSANHGAAGESVSFQATAGTTYWVVIEGVNCATGIATINYALSATPAFTTLPVSQTVTNGARVVLSAGTSGAPPLGYQWRFNGVNIVGATTNSFAVPAFRSTNEGKYTLLMSNGLGTSETPAAYVYLNNPPRFVDPGILNGYFLLQLAAPANSNYVIETSSDLVAWRPLRTNNSPVGFIITTDPVNAANKYYRARKQ
jgi:hypothetical protein